MLKNTKLGVLLFIVGFTGILTLLTVDVPISSHANTINTLTQFKLLLLVNPTIMLILFIVIGISLYDKMGFKLPVFEKIAFGRKVNIAYSSIFKVGVIGGVVSGSLLILISFLFRDYIPEELEQFDPNIFSRLTYGAFTEEIMLRFGLMTLIVWLIHFLFSKNNSLIYWAGIIISSLLFGLGHLPIVSNLTSEPSKELVFYIIFGNSVGGIVFGWLFWKKGLEAAIVAHFFAHLVLMLSDTLASHP